MDLKTNFLKYGEPVRVPPRTIELRPTVLNVLPAGTRENKMSFAFELAVGNGETVVVTQLSMKMLVESLTLDQREQFEKEWKTWARSRTRPDGGQRGHEF